MILKTNLLIINCKDWDDAVFLSIMQRLHAVKNYTLGHLNVAKLSSTIRSRSFDLAD
jgi:hypothetical protein